MPETSTARREPGADIPVGKGDDGSLTLLNAIRAYKKESTDARRTRMRKNRENRRAYLGIQDWSHKKKGQSREFLPKVPVAVEQFVSFTKRALTQFGPYYSVELGKNSKSPLSGEAIRRLMECHLTKLLVDDNRESSFPVLLSDGLKVGSLEALTIFKVHGNMVQDRRFVVEPGESTFSDDGQLTEAEPSLVATEFEHWRLRIDLIAPENYYPDPTGAGLYEIHAAKKDLSYVVARAEEGIYDKAAVEKIKEDYKTEDEEEDRRPYESGQDDTTSPSFRKTVLIDEFWGTILDSSGKVVHRNVFCAIANNKYVIRKPVPNPFWHQQSPFVAVPLLRVPFSQWHKALFDHATKINFAMNELYNLIIDGGIASVWGIKQVRLGDLEDPSQVTEGIPQGETLIVKDSVPHNAKVLETVAQGQVPQDSMVVFEMLSREFAAASLSNELKLGSLPAKQVLATEVVELSQSQAVTIDGLIGDIERDLIGSTLHKVWLTMLQNMDNIASDEVINAIGIGPAFALSALKPAERFALFATDCSFKVFGLSQVMSRTKDFQKLMAMLQAVTSVPILLQAFFKRYSPDRVLSSLIKMLGINPDQMARDDEEQKRILQEMQELPFFQQLAGQGGSSGQSGRDQGAGPPTTQAGSGISAENTGGPELPAEISAVGNPTAGLAGIGQG